MGPFLQRYGSTLLFCMWRPSLLQTLLSLLCVLGALVKNQGAEYAWVCFLALLLCSRGLWPVPMPVPICFNSIALFYSSEAGIVIAPALFFFLKSALAIWDLLWLCTNFSRVFFPFFMKNAIGIFFLVGL